MADEDDQQSPQPPEHAEGGTTPDDAARAAEGAISTEEVVAGPGAVPATPVATSPPAVAGTTRPSGYYVPRWLAVVLGLCIVFGAGFGVGWFASDEGGDHGLRIEAHVFPERRDGGRPIPRFAPPRRPSTAFLGVRLAQPSSGSGAQVVSVSSGSPADKAGLQSGDVITAVDGESVDSPADLVADIRNHDPGDSVRITYTRDGQSHTVTVTLGSTATSSTTPAS